MNLTDARFCDADKAREYLERLRWPDGPVCAHCGSLEATALDGVKHRPGVYQCNESQCREQFTVTVGTVMERSKIPLHKWLAAIHMLGASKKGVSAHQIHRTLGITYQSAWFLCHRIREAMREEGLDPIGGMGKTVEADETYFGKTKQRRPSKQRGARPFTKSGKPGPAGKRAVVALVERGGAARSFHVETADKATVTKIVAENVARESYLYTDESRLYGDADQLVAEHATVRHSGGEYVRGAVHTNTVENVFSVFKRGMKGVYQHCGEHHLHRYLAEFDFRYNRRSALGVTDTERAAAIVKGMGGKRLTYRQTQG
jgi:transposase-like protein